jgi:predicted ABC-type ATPase
MEKPNPIAYVLADPNGIGKTTANPYVIPSGVPYINADDIAKQLRERLPNTQTQELANAEAVERMNQFVVKKVDFAIESNLADNETWLFLSNLKRLGYAVHLYFLSTSDVSICIRRVALRYKQGGHFVRPDIVKFRYENGLKLLRFYKNMPDRLFLTDCSTTLNELCAEL